MLIAEIYFATKSLNFLDDIFKAAGSSFSSRRYANVLVVGGFLVLSSSQRIFWYLSEDISDFRSVPCAISQHQVEIFFLNRKVLIKQ